MRVSAIVLAAVLSGCVAAPYRPSEYRGARGDFDTDLAQCQDSASRVEPVNSTVAGAVVGAIFGALLGRAVGLNGHDTTQVAAIGAINGAAHGLEYGSVEWEAAVDRCMSRRGYDAVP
jgi:uncharacterized protein YcfJ